MHSTPSEGGLTDRENSRAVTVSDVYATLSVDCRPCLTACALPTRRSIAWLAGWLSPGEPPSPRAEVEVEHEDGCVVCVERGFGTVAV